MTKFPTDSDHQYRTQKTLAQMASQNDSHSSHQKVRKQVRFSSGGHNPARSSSRSSSLFAVPPANTSSMPDPLHQFGSSLAHASLPDDTHHNFPSITITPATPQHPNLSTISLSHSSDFFKSSPSPVLEHRRPNSTPLLTPSRQTDIRSTIPLRPPPLNFLPEETHPSSTSIPPLSSNISVPLKMEQMDLIMSSPPNSPRSSKTIKTEKMDLIMSSPPNSPKTSTHNFPKRTSSAASSLPIPLQHSSDFFKSISSMPTPQPSPPSVHAPDCFKPGRMDSGHDSSSTTPGSSFTNLRSSADFFKDLQPPDFLSLQNPIPPPSSCPVDPMHPTPTFVFNTDDLLTSRKTIRPWRGSRRAAEWIFSREELHANQLHIDHELPSEMDDPWYPSFAISPRDLESLHRYLLARYDVSNLDEYLQMLALYRNTRAIEAQNARQRYTELSAACTSVENARLSIIRKLEQRHSSPSP